jgi:hypothetical protein
MFLAIWPRRFTSRLLPVISAFGASLLEGERSACASRMEAPAPRCTWASFQPWASRNLGGRSEFH